MVAQKKGVARGSDDSDDLARQPLQAILLADSFATKFRPITLERPKVLLPLVNVPMINYTLAWLESAGVEEVIVFCCAHARQVIDYLESSDWFSQPHFTVTTIESHHCISAGDALRLIYERNVIRGDFVLISGDTVSNMSITQALREHKERRKKDANAVMTMIIKQSKPSPITHQSRLGTDELFMAIDPNTKQLLYYEEKADLSKGTISIDKSLLADNPSLAVQNDKQDCYIDICCPEVLSLFTDNFDYQHLRRHFVKGLLLDDIMGYKIFTHEIHSSYAARIDNYRSYDIVSKDIIQRWTYPYVPDVKFSGSRGAKLERQGMYRASEIVQSRSAEIGPFTVIGYGTKIGSDSKISNSVVGEGCSIGSNVIIEGSYIWDNVTIEDGCELRHVIVCNGVIMKARAVLKPGVIVSFKSLWITLYVGAEAHKITYPVLGSVSLEHYRFEMDFTWTDAIMTVDYIFKNVAGFNTLLYSSSSFPPLYRKLHDTLIKVVIGHQSVIPAYSKVSLLQQPATEDSDDELEYADNSSGIVEISSIQGTANKLNGEMTSEPSDTHEAELGSGGVGYIWLNREAGHEEEWRHSVAPIPADKLAEIKQAIDDDQEFIIQDGKVVLPSGDLKSDSNISEDDDNEDPKDESLDFEKEVEATFLRAVHENVKVEHVILEVNSLRLSYNMTAVDCAGAIFCPMMKLALETPYNSAHELLRNASNVITTWQKLLKSYLPDIDEEIEVILKFEEMCLEATREFSPLFDRILHLLYDKDILDEDAILRWADEKEGADESDRIFVKQSEKFIQWLREASEEED